MFELFLKEFSKQKKDELKVIFLDNGAFHKAKKLIVPDNIILIFLPPYSPELNAAEKVCWVIKRKINLCTFESLDELENKLDEIINKNITMKKIIKLTAYKTFLYAYQTI